MGQVGIGVIFTVDQGALRFISNGAGYYKVDIGAGTRFKDYKKIIKDAVGDNRRPLKIWSISWIVFLTGAAFLYFFYFHDAILRVNEVNTVIFSRL